MNKFTLSIFLASLLAAPVVQAADEEDHAAHHPDADQSQAATAQDDKAAGMKMDKMREKMKRMQEQMEKIHAARDPQERQKLMQEHMQSMQEGMKMMGRMGGGMKGGDMVAKAKKDQGEPTMGDGGGDMGGMMGGMMMKKHKKMEERMDMMQKMMEQMIEHEKAEQEMEPGR
jgi:hypothetical protein